jgi:hypothetical protein
MKKVKIAFAAMSICLSCSTIVRSQTPAISANPQQVEEPLIGRAAGIPVTSATPIISVSPVILKAPGRVVELQVKVTAPTTGKNLPIIIISHGHGSSNYLSSMYGYAPLANFWAAHGFIVIQPTHLDANFLQLNPMGSEGPTYWRSRMQDIKCILDQFDVIEKAVPEIKGRMDKSRVAIVGHSMGAFTAGMLLGEQVIDRNGVVVDMSDQRIKTGILLSAPGSGQDLTPIAAKVFADYHPNFNTLKKPVLIIAGDKDSSARETVRGYKWHTDAYILSNGPKCLIILTGGEHNLGGISGYDVAEAKDENPERVAIVQRLTWAYLRTALYPKDKAWTKASAAFAEMKESGLLECK